MSRRSTVFRPSAQMLVWVRVEELGETREFDLRVGALNRSPSGIVGNTAATSNFLTGSQLSDPSVALRQINQEIHLVEQQREALSIEAYELSRRTNESQRDLILQQLEDAREGAPRPWVLLGASPDSRFGRFGIQPLNCEINQNGFRTADTSKVTIDWKALPFDPRIVRSAAIELVIGSVSADDYAEGMTTNMIDPVTGLPRSIIAQDPGAPRAGGTTRFCGWVDKWGVEYGDEGDTVEIQCRDFTALFADTPLSADATLNLDAPIDEAIREMLQSYPVLAGFAVRYVGVPGRESAQAPKIGGSMPRTSRARRGRRARAARSGDQRVNLWDHLTDVCIPLGLIPVVKDYELQLVNPVTTYRSESTRRMVYGRNLSSLSFERNLGGVKVPTIECRAYDPTIGRIRWARWPTRDGEPGAGVIGSGTPPPRPLRANEMTPTGARAEERIQTYILKPMTGSELLTTAARSLFEQIGRQEIEGSFETHEISSWDIEADGPMSLEDADLLTMNVGDAVELLIAPRDRQRPETLPSSANDFAGMERQARARFLEGLGMSRRVAETIARLQDSVASMIFRISGALISFDQEEGIKVKVDFHNFVEVRETSSTTTGTQDDETATPTPGAIDASLQLSDLPEARDELLRTSSGRVESTIAAAQSEIGSEPVSGAQRAGEIGEQLRNEAAQVSIARNV